MLLRVAEPSGDLPSVLDVEVTWMPSGARVARRHRPAHGLCVIPWLGREERAHLAIRSASGEARMEIDRDRPDEERVFKLALKA
jgi:hypothetical protein